MIFISSLTFFQYPNCNHPKLSRLYIIGLDLGLDLELALGSFASIIGLDLKDEYICINQTGVRSKTHILHQYSRPQFNIDSGNIHAWPAHTTRFASAYPQAYLPLSYAAQIPTTHNPGLANVRVTLSKLNQEVRKCRARFLFCGYCWYCCKCVIVCDCVHV